MLEGGNQIVAGLSEEWQLIPLSGILHHCKVLNTSKLIIIGRGREGVPGKGKLSFVLSSIVLRTAFTPLLKY